MKNSSSQHSTSPISDYDDAVGGGREPPSAHDPTDRPRCDWDFSLSAVISSPAGSSDVIGVIEFDRTDSLFATGGIARKIRIYSLERLVKENGAAASLDHSAACEYYLCTPAKLSSLKWKPGSGSRAIGSGDYDGVVMEYDLERRMPVFERDEHGGQRVWTIDYSTWDPNFGASGSDDGTIQMWDARSDAGAGACIAPNRSPVCGVEFDPFAGFQITVGCADSRIYGYDVRRLVEPVFTLEGHRKAVAYTKFLDSQTVVSSSTDGCLMMWGTDDRRPIRRYTGHVNSRRFVGLSVWRKGGLLCCGSEDNQIFVYDKRWGDPVWVRGFAHPSPERSFVSGVCWRQTAEEDRCTLLAGGSDGVLQLFQGKRNKCY